MPDTSRRNYLTTSELAEFADVTISNTTEALDQISMAEELIDAYVGFQESFMPEVYNGKAQAGGATSLTLESTQTNSFDTDYLVGAMIEIIGGTGAGQRVRITANTSAGVLTTETFTTPPNSTSVYKIFQVGKFPRFIDCWLNSNESPVKWYKSIPEAVKRATAAQVQYIIEMGPEFFATDNSNKMSERIGDYSYTNAEGSGTVNRLIAPKAKLLLRGIKNIKGMILV